MKEGESPALAPTPLGDRHEAHSMPFLAELFPLLTGKTLQKDF
jgi:hypothetical protein